MTKSSLIIQIKEKADDLVELANTLWEICCDEYDAHCDLDADGNWDFIGPMRLRDDVVESEIIAKELEMLRANMDDWRIDRIR